MENNKSIIILTTFWNANYIISNGFALFPCGENKYCKINISKKDVNYSVYSIALSHPTIDEKLQDLQNMAQLPFFCPTYNMLSRYKNDRNWDKYTEDYKSLLRKRKEEIRNWIYSIDGDHVYILCCWENTAIKSKCHRQILYDAFKSSTLAKEKMIVFYEDGSKKLNYDDSEPFLNSQQNVTSGYILPIIQNIPISGRTINTDVYGNRIF